MMLLSTAFDSGKPQHRIEFRSKCSADQDGRVILLSVPIPDPETSESGDSVAQFVMCNSWLNGNLQVDRLALLLVPFEICILERI